MKNRELSIFILLNFLVLTLNSCKIDDSSVRGTLGAAPSSPNESLPSPPSAGLKLHMDEMSSCLLYGGDLTCWGENTHYEQLDGTQTDVLTPTPLTNLPTGVTSIAHGFDFVCVVLNGGVKCWGYNVYGQLGNNDPGNNSSTPVDVIGLTSGVKKVVAGWKHACALLDDGGVKCWGENSDGELGRGFMDGPSGYRATADYVTGLTSGVDDLFIGAIKAEHTCALINGGIKCWGYNAWGNLGDGSNSSKDIPTDVVGLGSAGSGVEFVAVSRYFSCAVLATRSAKCWGSNGNGQLGNNNKGTNTNSPVDVDLSALALDERFTYIEAGEDQACGLSDKGAVYCWGSRTYGQLGDGSLGGADVEAPAKNQITSGAVQLSVGRYHACALLDDDTLWCWGLNNFGQLGQNHTTNSENILQVSY